MKLKQWLYGATALAMLAACSDKDIAPGGDPNDGKTSFAEGTGYLGITLQLPSDLETRAADDGDQGDDRFDDGETWEYNVDNAALLLFVGPKTDQDGKKAEDLAKFVGAYKINAAEAFDQPNQDNVTTSFQRTITVKTPPTVGENDQLWGLAIVNYKDGDHFKITTGEEASTYGNLTIRTTVRTENQTDGVTYPVEEKVPVRIKQATETKPATTFEELREYITDCSFLKNVTNDKPEAIFMTNAPLSNLPGITNSPSGANIQTLARLDANFMASKTEAIQNPAGCVFVERAVAKVTISGFPTFAVLTHTAVDNADTGAAEYTDEKIKLPITAVSWMIDNEEKTSYIVRNAKSSNDFWAHARLNYNNSNRYRFVGNAGMNDYNYDNSSVHDSEGETWYRTYWCIDPAYNIIKDFNDQANAANPKYKDLITESGKYVSALPLYPHENTFNVANQTYQNTTRVVFKVTYSSTGQKVTLDANGDIATTGANVTNCNLYAVRGELQAFYLQTDADNMFKKSVLGSPSLHTLIKENLGSTTAEKINYNENDISISTGSATATEAASDDDIAEGDYIVKSFSFTNTFWNRRDIKYSSLDDLTTKATVVLGEDATQAEKDAKAQAAKDLAAYNRLVAKIVEDANNDYHIVPFTGNTAYYVVYLQHFGDTYCKLPTGWKGETPTAVYGSTDAEKDYLGRYGLVRNNWYDLDVSKILNLGRVTVPDGNVDLSDDNKTEEWYLSARIHVLSWARRTQHTEL